MKQVRFLKDYQHTPRRKWEKGDTPTIGHPLLQQLLKSKTVEIVGENNTRGITQEEMDRVLETEKNKEESKPKIITSSK